MKVSYNFHDLFNTPKPQVKEAIGEIRDFDSTFDTNHLRKFFQERESTISQTTFYTQREESLFDDLDLDRQNFDATPLSRVLSNSICDNFTLDPFPSVSANGDIQLPPRDFVNLHENPFGAENQSAPQVQKRSSESLQISMKNGNMVFNNGLETAQRHKSESHAVFNLVRSISFDQRKPQETVAQPSPVMKQQVFKNVEDEIPNFFNKLQAKKIFKIKRDVKSDKVLDNLKKKASSPKKKTTAGKQPLQVIRSQSANGNNIVFNFSSVAGGQKNSP